MRIFIPTHVVRDPGIGKLRMCKQKIKKAVPLDVVPERRTKRFPPRFRPVGRFCERVSDTFRPEGRRAGRGRNVGP